MKRFIAMVLLAVTIFSCCASLTACSSRSKKNHEYSYYTRSDGKRIWVKN